MRMLSAVILSAAVTMGCSQQVTTETEAAVIAPGAPATTPKASIDAPPATATTVSPATKPRAVPVAVIVPTHARGAIVASDVRGSASDDVAMAVAGDAASNVVTAGRLGGSGDIGCGMHASANGAAYVAKKDASGACTWAVYFDGSGFVSPAAVAVASDGSVFVTGSFDGTATFDAPYTSAGWADGFVVKLTSDGTIAWARTFGSTDDDYPYAVAVAGGTVAVGGAFYGTMLLGGDGSPSLTSNGDADAFLTTYSASDGGLVTSRGFGGPGWDAVNALTFDASAHLVAVGTHAGDLDLGLGSLASVGGQDGFVAVYDSSLAATSVRSFGGAGDDAAHGVAIDTSSRIIVAGYFASAADVGAPAPLTGMGQYSAFWAAYDGALAFDTAATLDSDGGIIAQALGIGATGDIVIGGQFTGSSGAGGGAGAIQMSAGVARAGYAASFSPSGTLVWATPIRASGDAAILSVASTATGIVAVGSSNGTLECSTVANAGGSDVVVMTLGN